MSILYRNVRFVLFALFVLYVNQRKKHRELTSLCKTNVGPEFISSYILTPFIPTKISQYLEWGIFMQDIFMQNINSFNLNMYAKCLKDK